MPGPAASGNRCKDCGKPVRFNQLSPRSRFHAHATPGSWIHVSPVDAVECMDIREQPEVLPDIWNEAIQ
jgi:hypothetical protein